MYRETTLGIVVEVEPTYAAEHSHPENSEFVFTYKVKITNSGKVPSQLISRHWIITDGNGKVHEVKGPGVIGKQPVIAPGESYEYSSFCPLPTPTGNMRGSYQMIDDQGVEHHVRIPLFFLRDLKNFH